MRFAFPAALMLVFVAFCPAAASLTDDEPSNDTIATAAIQMTPTAAVTSDGGELALVFHDIDYIGIGNLSVGDIVTVSTTPLDDARFEDPDTLIGLFTSGGSRVCENDDAINNELGNPATAGFGSLCRFVIDAAGTWYVGVTGSGDPPFDGVHFHNGAYALHVTINALVPPAPTATPSPTPAATPTPTPEPALIVQLVAGGVGLAWIARVRERRGRRAPGRDRKRFSAYAE